MSRGGSTGTQTTINNQDPWAEQQPFLEYGMQEAQNLYQSPTPQFFPASTVTPFSTQTTQAMGAQQNRALGGSPLEAMAQGQTLAGGAGAYLGGSGGIGQQQLQQTAGGQYTGANNPYLSGVTQSMSDVIQPQVQSRFEGYGRSPTGFGAGSEFTKQLAGAVAPYAFQDYNQERQLQMGAAGALEDQYARERQNQMAAIQNAPQMANIDYQNIGQLANVGAQQEAMGQAQLSDQIQRFNFEQLKPANKLAAYMQAIQGNYGGQSEITQPTYRPSALQGALGGGLMGASTANLLGSTNPMFALGGAALGAFA